MTHYVSRTCTDIGRKGSRDESESPSRLIEDFREMDAYVLLGAPGAGKTVAFDQEAAQCSDGHYVTARDFNTFDDKPEWHHATLFIDGLDEMRAGSMDERTPLDRIRNKLNSLGCPRFRLSCREADWFGATDRTRLQMVSKNGGVNELRLDPLSNDDIREILLRNHHIKDTDNFIDSARERGIDGLLPNPESLRMLVAAVAGGRWPETRMETFELACRTLLKEHSSEHRIANPDGADISRLMKVAGRLCAVQLLAGNAGYTLFANLSRDPGYPGLEQIPGDDRAVLRYTLGTKLFEAPFEGRVAPVHRQIAEFLAARYLARLIADGLPVGRILALMTGHDGVPVSELRGLSAWLAAHSRDSRLELITRDPLGTTLYGDIRGFPTEEKHRLLECLEREAKQKPWFWDLFGSDARLGDIATPDMGPTFREILGDPTRDDAKQSFVRILLLSLKHGRAIPGVSDPLLDVVKDGNWAIGVRCVAIDSLIQQTGDGEVAVNLLKSLLADIESGSVSDPEDELLGSLLTHVYPVKLSSTEVLRYIRQPKVAAFTSTYLLFWLNKVPNVSTNSQLAEILDTIVRDYPKLPLEFERRPEQVNPLRPVPILLLKRFLETLDKNISPNRLLKWLKMLPNPEPPESMDQVEFIRNWLTHHPGLLQETYKLGIEHCADSENFSHCAYELERRLFGITCLPDWVACPPEWWLEQAVSSTNCKVAGHFIDTVAVFVNRHSSDERLSRDKVRDRLVDKPMLMSAFNQQMTSFRDVVSLQNDVRLQDDENTSQFKQHWRNRVRTHKTALRKNRCPPALLHDLSAAYLGHFVNVEGETPLARLGYLLDNDQNLIHAVLEGLRGSINRSDLPSEDEILHLDSQSQQHLLTWPFMAGLDETTRTAPKRELSLDEKQMRLALTIHFTVLTPFGVRGTPTWLPSLLTSHPDVVADVLVHSVRPKINNNANFANYLYKLARLENHPEIARSAVLPLLKLFPVRCSRRHLPALQVLLNMARHHCEETSVLEVIESKLVYRSMTVAQRVHWLVAGLLIAPESYIERLESYVAGNEVRVRLLAEAVLGNRGVKDPSERLEGSALQLLIRMMGASYRPSSHTKSEEEHVYTLDRQASDHIRWAIDRLASDPSQCAAEMLHSLAKDDNLISWRTDLNFAINQQNDLRRESSFRHGDIAQVIQVLDNRLPANAADLAALTTEYLREISRNIRDGNTSDWKRYWNVDPYNRAECPKPEDACRDYLLRDLQIRLNPLDIDAQKEGRYPNDKRSDIRVSYGQRFNVPVEIKKSCHRDLWSAIRRQLIGKYTRDPGADGYGIYLVFWFGNSEHCRPTPGEKAPPKSAAQLEERLRDTLSEEEKRKISICVIDVAKPETLSRS